MHQNPHGSVIRALSSVLCLYLWLSIGSPLKAQEMAKKDDYLRGWRKGYIVLDGKKRAERGMLLVVKIGKKRRNKIHQEWCYIKCEDRDGNIYEGILEFSNDNQRKYHKWLRERLKTAKGIPCWALCIGRFKKKYPIYGLIRERPDRQFNSKKVIKDTEANL